MEPRTFPLRAFLVLVDATGVGVTWMAVMGVTGAEPSVARATALVVTVTAAVIAVCMMLLLYRARVCAVRSEELARLLLAAIVASAAMATAVAVAGGSLSAPAAAVGGVATFLTMAAARSGFSEWLRRCRIAGRFLRSVVVVGTTQEAFELYRLTETHPELGYRVRGVVGDADEAGGFEWGEAPWLGEMPDVVAATRRVGATGVLIAASALDVPAGPHLLRALLAAGVHVQLSSGASRVDYRRMRAAPLAHEPLFYVEPISLSKLNLAGKRVMDIALAGIGLVAASPLIILAAIATKLEDGGPIFHRQQRVGHNGRLITIFKMRTMVVDAAARFGEVAALNERHDGPLFKLDSDPRVTRVGRALRATSIDELPQLVNVLSGAMSMVGPRPALPDEVAQFDEELLGRLAMRPGITGLWQLEARDNPSFHAYRRLDLVYVENWSILSDIAILLGTARAVLARSLAALRPGHDDENRAVLDLRRLESEPQQVQV